MPVSFTTDHITGEITTHIAPPADGPLFAAANPGRSPFVFTGLAPYIDRAAADAGYEEWGLISRAKALWPATQVQNSLGLMPTLPAAPRAEVLDRVLAIRRQVAILLAGIDAAILDVAKHLNMPVPAEIAGEKVHHRTGHADPTDDHDLGHDVHPDEDGRPEGDPGQPRRRGGKRREG